MEGWKLRVSGWQLQFSQDNFKIPTKALLSQRSLKWIPLQKEIRTMRSHPSEKPVIFQGTSSVFVLCASAYKPLQHKPFGRVIVSFFDFVSLTFLSPLGTMLTLCVILCDRDQLALEEAMLPIHCHPSKDASCYQFVLATHHTDANSFLCKVDNGMNLFSAEECSLALGRWVKGTPLCGFCVCKL